jgi:rhamnosyltransferase
MSLAGAIILYNPNKSVWNNINSYLNEIDILYAIDNSDVPATGLVELFGNNPKIKYINNEQNLGIARALNIGANLAIKDNYEWLLTMDQDSSFTDNSFFKIFDELENKERLALFSPSHFQSQIKYKAIIEKSSVTIVMTSGNILNLKAFPSIGGFNEKLFIDEVDHDYCFRAILKGFNIIQCNIELKHQLGKTIFRNGKEITIHNNIRIYYITRNNLFVWKKYLIKFPSQIIRRIHWYIKYTYFILYYSKNRTETLSYIVKGFFHFMIGRYGKM